MSSLIKRNRNVVAALAALVLILVPLNISSASAEGGSSDTSLSTFTVDGNPVVDNQTVTLDPGTTSVAVVAVPTDELATLTVTGGTSLVTGDNPLNVFVTAADGVTTETHTVNLLVEAIPLSSDATLQTFTINGNTVVDGDDVYVAHGTESVTAVVETTSAAATYTITGTTDLIDGDNAVVVTVTAEDGTVATYTINIAVALNSDTTLVTFQVSGNDVVDGSVVELPAQSEEVDVLVETTDPDAIYEITGDTNLIAGENTLEVTVTAADGETTDSFFVTVNVAFNTDAGVNAIMIDGVEVVDGETIDLEPLTVSVEVGVETADADATYEITGDTDLVAGENTLTIVVTAADSTTTAEYTVTLNVLRNDDTSLATFQVNGQDVEDGSVVELDPLTSSVDVFLETTDENATTEITGDTDLLVGENSLEVVVTAADGETQETYTVILHVMPNTDATADITINGDSAVDGDVREFEWGVTEVEVEVTTTDPEATFSISGDTGLVVGENELSVIITAADGESYQTITVTLVVLPNTDASLSVFQINGEDANDGDVITAEPGSSSVGVEVETTDPEATYEITGDSDLLVGENDLVVSVLAADGVTMQDYAVTIIVPLNDDTSVTTLQIDGSDVTDGDILELAALTTEVDVVVETTDADATVDIEGANNLVVGENTLTITVTAADGETSETYTITLVVAANEDTSLAVFQINGEDANDGDVITVEPNTSNVAITVETTDPEATYEITGDSDLLVGENDLVVSVLAADGITMQDYVVTIIVPLNDDTSIASIVIDGTDVSAGDSVDLEPYTTDVDVDVETTDPEATFEIDGNHGLVTGENTVTITVTAADGETTETFELTLVVAVSEDTSLAVFQINGNDVADGDTLEVDPGSTEIEVDVETTDENATFTIAGDTNLLPGENDLVVSVLAADGVTARDYLVIVSVPFNNDTSIESIFVDGTEVAAGDSVDLEPFTPDVSVDVITTDPDATVDIAGAVNLVAGDNTLTITVTAADGETTETFELTLVVAFNNDTSLAFFQVNGTDVADGESIETEPGATDVMVDVETTDPDATVEIEGDTELVAGENTLVVTVTAADGETIATYSVIVNVPLNNDASVTSITVNGDQVYDGDAVELDPYTADVEVEVITTDADATFELEGASELVVGDNTLTITVTAADGETTQEYVITLNVALGDDASLATFQINGEDVENGGTITVDPRTTEVEVTVVTTDSEATFEISGNTDLTEGLNDVLVVITAQNGVDVMEYVVTVEVPANNDASVSAITIDGNDVADGDIVFLPADTTEVDVNVETTDPEADVVIEGAYNLEIGENTLTITVTAADGETTADYTITLMIAASDDTSLATFQVNEQDVQDGDVIELESLTTEVGVTVETTNPDATYEITGDTDLFPGENDLTVTVTAADGVTVEEFNIILNVASGTNTDLAKFNVAGADVEDGDIIELVPGTSDVEIDIEAEDPNATVTVVGDSGLVTGENTLTVTVVSADDSETTEYVVILFVLVGVDTSLSTFQIDGNDVADGDVVDLEPGTKSVDVEVITTDDNATFEVTGDTDLVVGENSLTVTVTAEDGETTAQYWITLVVPANTDTGVDVLEVNGTEVADGDTLDLDSGLTEVFVRVQTSDPEATFEVEGGTALIKGENTLIVRVTAADGETTQEYTITLYVPSDDASVTSILINGLASTSGDIITVAPDAESVDVEVTTTDENAKVEIKGADALVQGENEIVITVTAEDGTTQEFTFTVRVGGQSADTALTSLTVNGTEVTEGGTVQLPSRTSSVNVAAVTRDPAATVKVTGRTGLVVGSNTIQVAVTAPDLITVRYIYITAVVAPLSSNTDLTEFSVNGTNVTDNGTIELAPLTRGVTVVAKAADVESVVAVSGRSVVDGNNTLTVTVTAASGATRTYTVTMVVRVLSTDTTLKTLTIGGSDVTGGTYTAAPGTSSVSVTAVANDARATVSVIGASALRVGQNTVSVLVIAESGASRTYKITVTVPASNNAGLKSLQVNGSNTAVSSKVTLPRGTKSAVVKAVANEAEAKVVVTGATGLVAGDNNLVVTITAPDGLTVASYTVNLYVTPPSSDKTLRIFKINGQTVVDGGSISVPALTTSVNVEASTNDPEATVVVSGKSALNEGANTVSVVVTAADASTKTYTVTVRVLSLSSDNSLKSLQVNGSAYTSGTINLAFGVKSITVVPEVNDSGATAAVFGNTGLRTGNNTVLVRVTAANGAVAETSITVNVAKSNITALTALTVNGVNAAGGSTVTLPVRTTSANVKAVTADPEATAVASNTALVEGNNTVTVTVTAADGTVRTVSIPVYVTPLSSNTNLSTFKLNNVSVTDGGSITVANRTTSVPVAITAADSDAIVVVSGVSGLRTGNNTVTATVTAPNGSKRTYTVTVVVLRSSNTALASLTVNGLDASSGSTVTLPVRTTAASVKAVTADPEATAVASNTALVEGNNTVTVTVTAADGTVRTVSIPVYVTPLSSNTNLSVLKVNNVTVADAGSISVANKTLTVAVVATPEDAESVVAISGDSALRTGNNTVSILVTAPNGSKRTYTVTVVVLKSSNTDLKSLTVNGSAITAGATATLAPRSASAVIKAVTADPEATVAITGATGLVSGNNSASVTITAADGTTRQVSFTLYVTPLSSDNTLKSFQVNGSAYVADSTVELALGTTSVAVSALANDATASVEISGNTGLTGGLNTITVKVTAANGDVRNYTAKVNVPVRSSNANISTVAGTWTINGVDVSGIASDAVAVELPAGATAVSATAKTDDAKATIAITGATGLVTGSNTITFKVTAEDGTTIKTYTRTVNVKALSANTNLTSLTVAGQSVTNGATVNVVAGTTRVEVIPVLESAEARVTITGNTGLSTGSNNLVVTVTAPSGATATTTITVVVAAPASNTNLATFVINGTALTDGSVISVAAGTTRLRVSAIAADSTASVTVAGRSGLKTGANTVVVTVTAISGAQTTYRITVNVAG